MPDDTRESRTVEAALRVCGAVGISVGICRHLSRVGGRGVTRRCDCESEQHARREWSRCTILYSFCDFYNSYDTFKCFLYCLRKMAFVSVETVAYVMKLRSLLLQVSANEIL